MNPYLRELNKIEFAVTFACTGRCKHCSVGEAIGSPGYIDPGTAADAVRRITGKYAIETVMAFGGEPLLYPETVYAIMSAASEAGVPRRQVITNGYFSKDPDKVCDTVKKLRLSGVNDLLLSVDAFHQEYIPVESVLMFASTVKAEGIPIRIQPAWLVSRSSDNPYNRKTAEYLRLTAEIGIDESEGNTVFPEGNAAKYLSEYFTGNKVENPYTEDPENIRCLSFDPFGNVLDGNIFHEAIETVIENYRPKNQLKGE